MSSVKVIVEAPSMSTKLNGMVCPETEMVSLGSSWIACPPASSHHVRLAGG